MIVSPELLNFCSSPQYKPLKSHQAHKVCTFAVSLFVGFLFHCAALQLLKIIYNLFSWLSLELLFLFSVAIWLSFKAFFIHEAGPKDYGANMMLCAIEALNRYLHFGNTVSWIDSCGLILNWFMSHAVPLTWQNSVH